MVKTQVILKRERKGETKRQENRKNEEKYRGGKEKEKGPKKIN